MEGLVIDAYFAISKSPTEVLLPSAAEQCLRRRKDLYARFNILGSDDEDVCGENKANVIGATVNASDSCKSRGHVLVSAPSEKRFAMSWLTLQVAQLSHT